MSKSSLKQKAKKIVNAAKKELNKQLDASITIRLDADTKKRFSDVCVDMGMTVSSAVSVFVNRVIKEKSIPFKITATALNPINIDLMTENEFNSDMMKRYDEALNGEGVSADKYFEKFDKKVYA